MSLAEQRGAIHFAGSISRRWRPGETGRWTGGKFYVNSIGLYGRGLSRNYVHNLATISEIEALPEARLYNAYFEQGFYNNALNIRIGQQAADVEFFDSQTDNLFINGTFAGRPTRPTTFPPADRRRRSRCPAFASRPPCRTRSRCSRGVQWQFARPAKATRSFATIMAWRSGNDPPWLIGQVR